MGNRKSHYFYVLLCQDDSFYGGYTAEPKHRLTEHNSRTGAKYTRLAKRRPVKMAHTEKSEARSVATKAEVASKKLMRR